MRYLVNPPRVQPPRVYPPRIHVLIVLLLVLGLAFGGAIGGGAVFAQADAPGAASPDTSTADSTPPGGGSFAGRLRRCTLLVVIAVAPSGAWHPPPARSYGKVAPTDGCHTSELSCRELP